MTSETCEGPRVAVVASEPVGARMPGPAIRAWEIARSLTSAARVTLLAPEIELSAPGIVPMRLSDRRAARVLAESDIVLTQGYNLPVAHLVQLRGALVVDCYDPLSIELLEHYRKAPPDRWHQAKVRSLERYLLRRGDFFICATERQRAFWLGALLSEGRLGGHSYVKDPSLRSLIDVVPFGMPDGPPPPRTAPVLRGVYPEIGPEDPLIVWNGGIWNWLDPVTAVRATAVAAKTRTNLRLVFLGNKHPSAHVPRSAAAEEAQRVASELGVLGRHVFFYAGWLPYDQRADCLAEADLVICLHQDTLEAHLSFRSRLLDCLWAGVPILCSSGDYFAELVQQHGLGEAVPPGDVGMVASAMLELTAPARNQACRERIPDSAVPLRWSRVTEPLRRFCGRYTNGRPAHHRLGPAARLIAELSSEAVRQGRWGQLPKYVIQFMAAGTN